MNLQETIEKYKLNEVVDFKRIEKLANTKWFTVYSIFSLIFSNLALALVAYLLVRLFLYLSGWGNYDFGYILLILILVAYLIFATLFASLLLTIYILKNLIYGKRLDIHKKLKGELKKLITMKFLIGLLANNISSWCKFPLTRTL
ncbi:hypothetical protein SCLARK_001191 [Spiroplasma clarkii]|uniref:hypothetical protein n=1 Tax=Spiroplasma clarkii TaxID=2139 RepID=UPI000B556351|nr:hypothetical protein [Spiroplasma clarkii]ARU91748.1 hypothetical protein SCLARK_001191 [Spiroplasma clarkii]